MKVTRMFVSATLAAALLAGAAPAFAYYELPVPLVRTEGHENLRELYAKTVFSVSEMTRVSRMPSEADFTGRAFLARSQIRAAQRNFRRHVLGYLRGLDYRVLNISGDFRKRGVMSLDDSLPNSLVVTGAGDTDDVGFWGWDRPTRRDVENSGGR